MIRNRIQMVVFAALVLAVLAGAGWLYGTGKLSAWIGGTPNDAKAANRFQVPKLIERDGQFGLELTKDAIASLELNPTAALLPALDISLPPMIGTVNYDADRLFTINPLFTGQVSELKQVDETRESINNGSTAFKVSQRPIKFGDRVKQGEVLAVFWSRDIGERKAALVDAICNLRLSQDALSRQQRLFNEAATALASVKLAERQVQIDGNAAMTAERNLRMWKLNDAEIKGIKDEANLIHDQKKVRDVIQEVNKWARVELKVPWFDPGNPKRELTIVEKNVNLGASVDPANYNTPPFRIADLSRLQIWVHPPEEYLPILRKQLALGPRGLRWRIRFQAESAKVPPLDLSVEQISHGLDPAQHTPMVIGYLDNPDYKHLIGQFVTATIYIRPPEDTVEVPTDAINPLAGQDFVFIENSEAKNQFLIRRVSVAQSFKKTSYVRTILTPEQERANLDLREGEYPIQRLNPGDRVVTRGVVEFTAALEELRNAKKTGKE